MTKPAARTVANVVILSAGVAAAYVVLTTPPLRRLAGMASSRWLGASLPILMFTEARRAWVKSGQRQRDENASRRERAPASVRGEGGSGDREGRPLT